MWPLGAPPVGSVSFSRAPITFWVVPYFLAPQGIPDSSCVFPVLSLESIMPPRSPGSFIREVYFRPSFIHSSFTDEHLVCFQFSLLQMVQQTFPEWTLNRKKRRGNKRKTNEYALMQLLLRKEKDPSAKNLLPKRKEIVLDHVWLKQKRTHFIR